jgi:hypothetical protein
LLGEFAARSSSSIVMGNTVEGAQRPQLDGPSHHLSILPEPSGPTPISGGLQRIQSRSTVDLNMNTDTSKARKQAYRTISPVRIKALSRIQ